MPDVSLPTPLLPRAVECQQTLAVQAASSGEGQTAVSCQDAAPVVPPPVPSAALPPNSAASAATSSPSFSAAGVQGAATDDVAAATRQEQRDPSRVQELQATGEGPSGVRPPQRRIVQAPVATSSRTWGNSYSSSEDESCPYLRPCTRPKRKIGQTTIQRESSPQTQPRPPRSSGLAAPLVKKER